MANSKLQSSTIIANLAPQITIFLPIEDCRSLMMTTDHYTFLLHEDRRSQCTYCKNTEDDCIL